ncbi:hypothetical protein BH10ACI4_BH10ACI4_38200 [soil metagenome]
MHPLFDQIELVLAQALSGLDSRQAQLRSSDHPDQWTIQQVVEHLNLTYKSTQDIMQARLARGRPTLSCPSFSQHMMRIAVTHVGFFPKGRRAPAIVTPAESDVLLNGDQLVASVHQNLVCADPVFEQVESAFGDRPAVTHHVMGPLSVPQWRRFHLVHGRHHAKQILAIRGVHGI